MVKKSEILENAQKVNTIVFDKTGTLTYGKLKVSKIINYSKLELKELMQIAGSLESRSTHPIGKAFTDFLTENKIETLNVENFEDISGFGIVGTIGKDEIILGNSKILSKYQIKNTHQKDEKVLTENGNSIIYVVKNKEIIALIGVNDVIREYTKEIINSLKVLRNRNYYAYRR